MNGFDFVFERFPNCNATSWLEVVEVKRGQYLVSQGQVLDTLYWVESGLLREFHQDDEGEFTTSFVSDGSYYLTGFYFGEKARSSFSLEALENCRVLSLPMEFFHWAEENPPAILNTFKDISRLKYFHNLQWKLINGKKPFMAKWEYFKKTYPRLWIRIPQKHLATYFNVTPQYISRLKGQRLL